MKQTIEDRESGGGIVGKAVTTVKRNKGKFAFFFVVSVVVIIALAA